MDLKSWPGAFRRLLRSISVELREKFRDAIGDEERLSRFFTETSKFTRPARVRPKAFEPKFDKERLRFEASVFRTSGSTEAEVWQHGDAHFATKVGKPILARGDLLASVIRAENLRIISDEPPPRHAVVIDWPDEKDARMDMQNALAAAATLVMRP